MPQLEQTFDAFARLLTYPDDQTVETAELLYVLLQDEVPKAASKISAFGAAVEQHEQWQMEEAYTRTFDVNPTCAFEVGWHLFGEEHVRGLFLVRMREELRRFGLEETCELPDHLVHVLAIIASMNADEAAKLVCACVLPAIEKMEAAFEDKETPYRNVIDALAAVLRNEWGALRDEAVAAADHVATDHNAIPEGVDLLRAYPVSDAPGGCGGQLPPSIPAPWGVSDALGGGPINPAATPDANVEFVPLKVNYPNAPGQCGSGGCGCNSSSEITPTQTREP